VWHRAATVRRLLPATVDAGAKAARLAPRLPPTAPDEPPGRTVFDVDARTLMDALEAIGAEPGEAAVAETLLDQLLEHTGARYGALLLRSGSGLRVAAQRADSPELFVSTSDVGIEDGELPLACLRDVLRDHQSHTVRDATALSEGAILMQHFLMQKWWVLPGS
jgi:GAF domain-containing protein